MPEVLQGVSRLTTFAVVWSVLNGMFASCTHAWSVNTRITLAITWKGTTTMDDYFNKMKSHTEEMADSSQPLGDEEFVADILTGLD
jgi:predicted 3-demethylubiquinone-9 3-methyltransferase (glyoxalase superfamily)